MTTKRKTNKSPATERTLYAIVSAVLALTIAVCAAISYSGFRADEARAFSLSSPDVQVVLFDGGGSTVEYFKRYNLMRLEGKRLRVEGPCISACTYFLGVLPKTHVCAGERATFGFHGVYRAGILSREFDQPWTKNWHEWVYPAYVNDMLTKAGFDGNSDVDEATHPDGLIWMTREELRLQDCPAD